MAKRQPQPETPQTPEPLDLTGLETGEMLNPALEAIYAEMGVDERGKIKLYITKLIEDTGKEARVWEGPPSDYDLMAVARRFGSGDYRVKLYVPHDSGRIVLGGNQLFTILLDPSEDAKIVAMRKGAPDIQQAAAPQSLSPESLALAIASAIKAGMPAPVDPFQQMTVLAGIMKQLMPAQQAAAPVGTSFAETLSAAKSLIDISRGFTPPVDADGRTDVKGAALTRGIDLVAKMFEKGLEQGKPNPGAAPAQPALAAPHAQGEPGNVAPQKLTEDQQEELDMLRLQIKLVNREAKTKSDPIALVEKYYEDLPDAVFDLIVFDPNWFAVLCQNVPDCAQYKEWYELLRLAIIEKGVKDGDLKANPDGSLMFTEEPDTTASGAVA
jgi:hypothetical protein